MASQTTAVKFTPAGGEVRVRVDSAGAFACVHIQDTGKGIEVGLLPYIFDRFRQADSGTTRSNTGLGLGLSIVRQLAMMHGGSVEAESSGAGQGANFTLRIPLAPVDESARPVVARAAAPAAIEPPDSLEGLRILVVDDDRDTRDLLVTTFENLAAQALAVPSVDQALRAVATFRPTVIVSDIGMPGEDGYALATALRTLPPEEGGNTPAIALTAFAAPHDGDQAIAAGFSAYLAKPVDPGRLISVVAHLGRGRSGR